MFDQRHFGEELEIVLDPVEARTEATDEVLEVIEDAQLIEDLSVGRERMRSGEAASTAARRLLVSLGVRRAVGAREEPGVVEPDSSSKHVLVRLTLQDGEAVAVRLDATYQQVVPIEQQVLRRDARSGKTRVIGENPVHRFTCGGMLEDDLELGELAAQPRHVPLDEHGLSIEDVDLRVSHFTVKAKHHTGFRHRSEDRGEGTDVSDAVCRARGGMSRVELGCDRGALVSNRVDEVRIGLIREVQRELRQEVRLRGRVAGALHLLRVGEETIRGRDRRLGVWHEQSAAPPARDGVCNSIDQTVALAHVKMCVERGSNREGA